MRGENMITSKYSVNLMSSNMNSVNISDSSDAMMCLAGEIAKTVAKLVVPIPLCISVLYLGLQQWRKQRSFKSASHSDIFTYHVAVLEMIWLLASVFHLFGAPVTTPFSEKAVRFFFTVSWFGETFFHVLTCVERYLAVVHPIVYMRLRNERGVRIRNISIVCVWILSCVYSAFIILYSSPLLYLVPFGLCLVAASFCSFSVLYVLVRPGPGDGVQDREWVDPAKQRAFFTITAISVALWLWFGGILNFFSLDLSGSMSYTAKCVLTVFTFILYIPSSSVLPLLYLHRAGKLSGCFHQKS